MIFAGRWAGWLPQGVLVIAVLAFAGVVWLSYHPEHPLLERAAGWPLIGGAAHELRAVYLPADKDEATSAEPSARPPKHIVVYRPQESAPASGARVKAPSRDGSEGLATGHEIEIVAPPRPDWMLPEGVVGFEWLRAGATLREEPAVRARALFELDTLASLPVLERRADGWARVRIGSREGWVDTASARLETPPLGSGLRPVVALPGRAPEPERLERALKLIPGAAEHRAGPHRLHTDVRDRTLLARLDAAAARIESAYRRRTGLALAGEPAAAVVLFAREADYRRHQAGEPQIAGLDARGHAGHGLAVLYRGDRSPAEIEATLVHELTHLLNRRGIGPALPPWLDEGLAEDMARSEPLPAGDPLPLDRLLALSEDDLRDDPLRRRFYAQSHALVRYLLDHPKLAPRFRTYLAAIATGTPATPEELTRHLARSLESLDADLGTGYGKGPERTPRALD